MTHLHRWIKTLMDNLDAEVDEETRAKILENCGRTCISSGFVKKAQACKKNAETMEEFLDNLSKMWNQLRREKGDVYVVYEKCYCPLVKKYSGKLSPIWCSCSRGWIKELFESALQRPVDVVFEKSIKQGNDVCKFKVCL